MVAMNKRILSSIFLLAITATLGILPTAVPRAHALGTASLTVSPSFTAGNPGDVFTVQVSVDNVANLAGYDVQLNYNGIAIHATSVDFTGPFTGVCPTFPIGQTVSDSAGVVRSTLVTLGGCSTTVSDLSTGPTPVFTVTYTVVARASSPLTVSTDSDCSCNTLAALVNNVAVAVSHDTFNGNFFAEPNIVFHQTYNVTSDPRTAKEVNGAATVRLSSEVFIDRSENLAGFVFVVFDIFTPDGKDVTVQSQTIFLGVGASFVFTLTHTWSVKGTYSTTVTLVRGSQIFAAVPFESLTGQNFRVV